MLCIACPMADVTCDPCRERPIQADILHCLPTNWSGLLMLQLMLQNATTFSPLCTACVATGWL